MPAYRSSAEADIRDAVVARIRQHRPNARIIHEINVSTYGPNRIDLIAVCDAEILAVEIKSAKDKLDRLPAQIAAMRGVAHHVVVALHEKFLIDVKTHFKARHFERDGSPFLRTLPDGWDHSVHAWVFPEVRRCIDPDWHDPLAVWHFPEVRLDAPLPAAALDMLWRDELLTMCEALRVSVSRRSNMGEMVDALRWHCTGRELTRGICAMLRARPCIEADPEITEEIAMAKLTEAERRNLSLLTDEWLTVHDLASKHPSGAQGVTGIANAFGRLAKRGLAEWAVRGNYSNYRITPAGRRILEDRDNG